MTPAESKKATRDAALATEQARADMRALCSVPSNRRALRWILNQQGAGVVPRSPVTHSSAGFDSHATAYQLGFRDAGEALMNTIRMLDPLGWGAFVSEGVDQISQAEALRQATGKSRLLTNRPSSPYTRRRVRDGP